MTIYYLLLTFRRSKKKTIYNISTKLYSIVMAKNVTLFMVWTKYLF